jgi:hypothetical protein
MDSYRMLKLIDDTHLARPGQGVFSEQAAGEMRYADEQVHA